MSDHLKAQYAAALHVLRDEHDIRLDGEGTDALTTWFLGPKGENGALL